MQTGAFTGSLHFALLPIRLSSFVGREPETAELTSLLATHRLVTLVGAPGVGKTRLALHVAESVASSNRDGVVFVELAGLAEPELVARVVAATLGVQEQAGQPIIRTVSHALAGREVLLVLDNCEHLVAACAGLAETLLGACPLLRLLATSREALRCEGELVWRVPSLSIPAPPARTPAAALRSFAVSDMLAFESVRLFVDRATAVRPDFALTEDQAPAVVTICQRLDGIPLALELAAARVRLLPPGQIADRIEDRLRLLTGGARTAPARQQTLEATIDWSFRLLPEAEQALLRRLSVFAGGWTLDAAEAVCHEAAPSAAPRKAHFLDLFGQLVDKSLVQVDPEVAGEPRFRLLEMVRQFAFERLVEAGEAAAIRDRHVDWFLHHVEKTEPLAYWAPPVDWLDRLEADHDNLRAALDWSLVGPDFGPSDAEAGQMRGLHLAIALFWPWFDRDHIGELRWWFDALLAASADHRSSLRARVLLGASLLAIHQRQIPVAIRLHEQGEMLAHELNDAWAIAWATEARSHFARVRGSPEEAAPQMREALRQFRAVGYRWGESWALRDLGSTALYRGNFDEARSLLEQSLAISREIGDGYCVSLGLEYLGRVALGQRDFVRARAWLDEASEIAGRLKYGQGISRAGMALARLALAAGQLRRACDDLTSSLHQNYILGQPGGLANCLEGFARISIEVNRPGQAARLVAAASALRSAAGAPHQPIDRTDYDELLARVAALLRPDELEQLTREGAALTTELAIAEAHDVARQVAATTDASGSGATKTRAAGEELPGPLTNREQEVAALVARGLTNRQIAETLVVSRRTVDAHVASILGRLGFATRAQIAVWAAEHGLGSSIAGDRT